MSAHLHPVTSSAIAAIGYDQAGAVLVVRFVSGETYEYLGVPADMFAAVEAADSKGRFVNYQIKPRYRCRHVL